MFYLRSVFRLLRLQVRTPWKIKLANLRKLTMIKISLDERKRLCIGIEDIIQRLEIQKDQSKFLRHPITWSENRAHPTLENLAVLLRRLCVVTDEGLIVTFECWKEDKPKFKGQFILPEDAEHTQRSYPRRSEDVPPEIIEPSAVREEAPGKALATEIPKSHIPEIISASETSSTSRSPGISRRTSITSDSCGSHYYVPNVPETGNALEQLVGRKQRGTEGSIASDVVQLVGSLSSPLNLQESVLSEGPTEAIFSTEYIVEQSLVTSDHPREEEGLPGPIAETSEVVAEQEEEGLPNQNAENPMVAEQEQEELASPTVENPEVIAEQEEEELTNQITDDPVVAEQDEEGLGIPTVENPEAVVELEERGSPSPVVETPEVVTEPSSPSNQIQEENAASATTLQGSATTVTKPFVSHKRKRKIFQPFTVEDLLSESRSDKELQSHQASLLLRKRQEKDDEYFPRILRLNKAESDVKAELDTLNASAKSEELCCQRRIDALFKVIHSGGQANWEEYRELIRKRDSLREDYTRQTVRLVDKASKIANEKAWCLSQKNKAVEELDNATQDKGQNGESVTPTVTTSSSSVSDTMDAGSGPVPFSTIDHFPTMDSMLAETRVEGYSMAREFLKRLIPWAKMEPEPVSDPSPAELEAAAAIAAADAKKKMRRKKRLRW